MFSLYSIRYIPNRGCTQCLFCFVWNTCWQKNTVAAWFLDILKLVSFLLLFPISYMFAVSCQNLNFNWITFLSNCILKNHFYSAFHRFHRFLCWKCNFHGVWQGSSPVHNPGLQQDCFLYVGQVLNFCVGSYCWYRWQIVAGVFFVMFKGTVS